MCAQPLNGVDTEQAVQEIESLLRWLDHLKRNLVYFPTHDLLIQSLFFKICVRDAPRDHDVKKDTDGPHISFRVVVLEKHLGWHVGTGPCIAVHSFYGVVFARKTKVYQFYLVLLTDYVLCFNVSMTNILSVQIIYGKKELFDSSGSVWLRKVNSIDYLFEEGASFTPLLHHHKVFVVSVNFY